MTTEQLNRAKHIEKLISAINEYEKSKAELEEKKG